ncbi:hypothetical protein F5B22DRAFT_598630 [Xylaria bambusicola]|uniref:uncharacterized protein n=1 Tax=Xylaria bambusicola TaxID=326684 RepID=UPI002008B453|nr:uncharacterized protein F5B22DRAFT_598630 [Xylaria bambusicola]KAI0520858.1 hypothetical protein F5B22DRAFT_598630 [Xylaria bambusicola]
MDNWPIDPTTLELRDLLIYAKNQSLFKTDNGYLGIVPPNIKPGDLICATNAQSLPILLRKITEPPILQASILTLQHLIVTLTESRTEITRDV